MQKYLLLKKSITKSRSGHYSVTINSPSGRLFHAVKIGTLRSAQLILENASRRILDLLKAKGPVQDVNFELDYSCLYIVQTGNLYRFVAYQKGEL